MPTMSYINLGRAPLPLPAIPSLRLAATGSRLLQNTSGVNHYFNSRSPHEARSDISALKIVLANWYYTSSTQTETASGGEATYTASVEYPAGTFTQITFDGETAGVAASGASLTSDLVNVTIPNGELFWIRVYCGCPSGNIVYQQGNRREDHGQAFTFSASAMTDLTMSGSITQAAGNVLNYTPLAVVAMSTAPAVMILGDSIAYGTSDTLDDDETFGLIERSIHSAVAYTNFGAPSDSFTNYASKSEKRRGMLQYCTHVVSELGINQISTAGLASAQLWARAVWALMDGLPIYQTTLTPRTTSTDNWATTANQSSPNGFTPTGASTREAFNDWVRSGPEELAGYFEVADVLESARNSGLWAVSGAANYHTADGLHPNRAGYIAVRDAGAIGASLFT